MSGPTATSLLILKLWLQLSWTRQPLPSRNTNLKSRSFPNTESGATTRSLRLIVFSHRDCCGLSSGVSSVLPRKCWHCSISSSLADSSLLTRYKTVVSYSTMVVSLHVRRIFPSKVFLFQARSILVNTVGAWKRCHTQIPNSDILAAGIVLNLLEFLS
ncbi:hypothetical protein DENSPDRAFT_843770 [Dentipellis sp. KUC8613]|nr:hypothetical protein DENSPDRAFT_843770 [Dentipellis sp. KUC8613]